MTSVNSLLRTISHVNKVLLNTTIYKQRLPPPLLNCRNTFFTTTGNRGLFGSTNKTETSEKEGVAEDGKELDIKDFEEMQRLLSERESQLEASKKEAADFKDKYVRSLAESENIRRRGLKQVSDTKLYAIQGLAKDMLEVADILEKASDSVPQELREQNEHLQQLFEGVVMTGTELQKVFKKHGLEKVDPLDEPFDPNFHDALFRFPAEGKASGTVSIVQKIGYKLHGRPLRAALVGVVP